MKLLVLIHSLRAGGAERVTASLASRWAAAGWDVTVATFEPQSGDFYALHPGVRREVIGLAGESSGTLHGLTQNLRRVRAVRRLLRDTGPQAAIGMMTSASVVLGLARIGLSGIRVIGSERIHPPRMPLGAAWEWLRRVCYGLLDAVVALDRASAAWIETHTRAPAVTVIPNPAQWPLPRRAPMLPVECHVAPRQRMLLAVGRLDHQKGFDRLVDAFAAIADRRPDWMLVIIGEGRERASLEARIRAAGLAERIRLPGLAGNVGDWYARADLYVLSSRFEGFPNTLVEAMAAGVAVVAFTCETGPADIVRDGRDGLLVPEGDVAALGAALASLMDDDARRNAFAAHAVEARERYAIDRVAALWEAAVRGDASGSDGRAAGRAVKASVLR